MSARRREGLRLRALGLAWLAGWRVTRLLPERIALRLFERFAERSARRDARKRAIVRANLAPVVPPEALEATVLEAFRSYGRYWAQTFRMQDLSSAEFGRRFHVDGREHIEEAHAAGRGGVLATLHLGNWDAGGRWVAERWPLCAVVEVVRPRLLFDRFVAHRRSLGIRVVPLAKGQDATGQCLERLGAGDIVGLVSDRDLSGGGIEVGMFGRRTRLPAGPAVLAVRSGAPLIPACVYMEPNGEWRAWIMPRIDENVDPADAVRVLTQRLAGAFERMIARAPEQWHAFERRWLP